MMIRIRQPRQTKLSARKGREILQYIEVANADREIGKIDHIMKPTLSISALCNRASNKSMHC